MTRYFMEQNATLFDFRLYRNQHQKLMSMLEEMQTLLVETALPSNASRARSLLSQLAAALSIHIYLEEKELYLEILNDRDAVVRDKAQVYMDEMGDLMAAFKFFLAKYHSVEQILEVPMIFINDTLNVIQALSRRIMAEETDLFTMLEGLK